MASSTTEADVIFNRASVALARSQRLIASWLPPKTQEEIAHEKTEEELQREEDEIFTPVPEKLGLGAPLPNSQSDGCRNRAELNSNDKLRKQLLGRNSKTITPSRNPSGQQTKQKRTNKPIPSPTSDSETEEESRSSLVTRNKKKTSHSKNVANTVEPDGDIEPTRKKLGTKRAGSYLDELLSTRTKKKKAKRGGD
ncbi:uncharacterized protein CIMG_08547 [Coccidioides immitis RS]|uniref:Uncharacterized protein n=4 Tax=Coccidioides immitis TaxID=5501 RepID=J3K5Q9_COCIM|nr:uncharacterized protein CIMG_08547 [Coccidioides immitis RS]KMP06823.1 hypothetical protein CIRG_06504 [Coccidioides immitis RMSCC 2394]KMU79297.1 hypothetical protein CISG_07728 [Coccidioides immitis RMSCC 3703]KMU91613.1 hypothetical protein CIHG_09468 [Coccidioides immitis H538.4]TPX22293.1 hypothetical protein DIZ76_014161 [Coccidioides immitis]EAS29801.3 hypothetical protein CIMG_08547 [Coccidioides immitis RS]